MEIKSIWESKTFWLAVVQAIAGVIVVFQTHFPEVGFLVMVKSIIDVVLRLVSTSQVTLKG